jgi:hypothetical protein
MIEAHLNAIEQVLIAQSKAAQNAGHLDLRGGPREWFVRDFLVGHLPATLEVGQGELIDADSRPEPMRGAYRPQVDVVLYRRDLPRISYSTGNAAYLAEGVMATVETKSDLTRQGLERTCEVAIEHGRLTRSFVPRTGFQSPIRNYVLGYQGADVQTVATWLSEISGNLNAHPAQMVDMVVVLGKGVIWRIDDFPTMPVKKGAADHAWALLSQTGNNLFIMFMHMLTWMNKRWALPNTRGYVANSVFDRA